jgi:pimeloyl-ACP methyl ester carboxylesterase
MTNHRAMTQAQQTHSPGVSRAYERVLARSSVRSRAVDLPGRGKVHLLDRGAGPSLLLLHGSVASAGMFLPLLSALDGVHAMAPDRPGQGLSDPIELPRVRYREAAVDWLDRVLDALGLDATALLGHSGGAVWALWYALARPNRVSRLGLIAPPTTPKTRCPMPLRLAGTPGLGELLSRAAPPSPKSALRFAGFMGEGTTLARHPDLVDLWVATGRDPVADRVGREELRVFVSPFALLMRSGFRRRSRVRPDELRRLTVPTLVVWGEHDPIGSVAVARAVTGLIPTARLEVLPGGHAPWLGQPARTAAAVVDFMQWPKQRRQGGAT